jgi:hypothetical protein
MAFLNLASSATPENIERVTAICKAELEAAGIEPFIFGEFFGRGEVPSRCVGALANWRFERAWYYWQASGNGIPPDIAEKLHATYGRVVRVHGHCGCPSPLEYNRGFAVGSYHIDTPEGLKALADTLRAIWDANAPSTPTTGEK